jgi:hypothetical protein
MNHIVGKSSLTGFAQMMHVLDYDRALGELLELDDTIRASIARAFQKKITCEVIVGQLTTYLSQTSRKSVNWKTL